MGLEPPVSLASLGGLAPFTAARSRAMIAATIGQLRLADVLDAIGPPGKWHCDPQLGTLALRGRTFAAEMLGSFDGRNWLWTWANPSLAVPETKTTLSRGARDRGLCGVASAGFVELDESLGPHDIATVMTGNGLGEAYYVCQFPNAWHVYAVMPGQLQPVWPKLYELQRAVNQAMMLGLEDGAAALARGAEQLGLATERGSGRMVVRDGSETLVAELDGVHLATVTSSVTL